ncbi:MULTISPECIES: PTS glucose transporter subunit IIA [Paenibacillus]|uniref:PTS sugar transporter subunit IIA n=1 Tax=Paenibacillus TaxID=44249 RepID=UPI000CF9BACD|nr:MULTISPECIES: PTS glucose transporter subunit IIA [Paenibacillus]PQP89452.1 PTS glucose transporter subunit IIA [Paenibacillus sp. AR247]
MFSKWKSKKQQTLEITSPLTGTAVPLDQVPDEAFAGGHMGKGLAIEPADGKLIAPFDGVVAHVIKSKHAVIVEQENGLQFLFHIGINTVGLKGSGFTSHVNTGDKVKAGQTLIEFDIEAIRAAGLPTVTPVIITNSEDKVEQMETKLGAVTAGQTEILSVTLKS